MRKRGIAYMITLALLMPAVVLAGGGTKGDFEVGVYLGYGQYDDYKNTTPVMTPGDFNPDDDLLQGVRIGYWFTPHFSTELSYQQLASDTSFFPGVAVPNTDFDIDSIRLNFNWNFRPEMRFRPFITIGAGSESTEVPTTPLFDESDNGFNLGGGLRWFLGETFSLRYDVRLVSTDVGGVVNDEQGNLESSIGASWTFGGAAPADTDGDGVRDRKDDCPGTPARAIVDINGCPLDGDGDGVPDGIDRCPDTPEGWAVDATGCPRDTDGDGVVDGNDSCPGTPKGAIVDSNGCPKDTDGDGVADGPDKCPDTPRGATVDARGCPADADGDGVFDGIDKCPGTPRGAKVDATGCPVDSDGDGVIDGLDKCPNTPAGSRVDRNGCKLRELTFDETKGTLVLTGVNFEFNKAVLTPSARGVLDEVARSLKEWSDIRVEVGGHTDSVGSESYNQRLSQQRADAVRTYLISKGIAAGRLTSKGYGEVAPMVKNDSDANRAMNRRVELKKLN